MDIGLEKDTPNPCKSMLTCLACTCCVNSDQMPDLCPLNTYTAPRPSASNGAPTTISAKKLQNNKSASCAHEKLFLSLKKKERKKKKKEKKSMLSFFCPPTCKTVVFVNYTCNIIWIALILLISHVDIYISRMWTYM